MARILIVGCGCHGRELASELTARGHAVRGTTRREERRPDIEAAGGEAVLGDPDRLQTLTPHLEGVSVLVWAMGRATGDHQAVAGLHGPRLESMVQTLVDTPVRGVVYEAAGSVDPSLLASGAEVVRRVAAANLMPAVIVDTAHDDSRAWVATMADAVDRVLA